MTKDMSETKKTFRLFLIYLSCVLLFLFMWGVYSVRNIRATPLVEYSISENKKVDSSSFIFSYILNHDDSIFLEFQYDIKKCVDAEVRYSIEMYKDNVLIHDEKEVSKLGYLDGQGVDKDFLEVNIEESGQYFFKVTIEKSGQYSFFDSKWILYRK